MTFTTTWLVQDHLLESVSQGEVSVEEAVAQGNSLAALVMSTAPPVHIILDLSDVIPSGFPMSEMPKLAAIKVPSSGWTVIVVQNRIIRLISSIGLRLRGIDFRVFHTREQALDFLCQVDAELRIKLQG
jgi:hypothetical protein